MLQCGDIYQKEAFEFPTIMKVPPGRLELPAQASGSVIVSKLGGWGRVGG
jgi:hypothetical protein